MNYLIWFLTETLFFTNVWILIYTNILVILNFLFPPIMKEQFYRPAAAFPEAFEMPLYLLLSFIFVLIIWSLHKFFSSLYLKLDHPGKKSSLISLFKFAVLIGLFLVFIGKLGKFPMANEWYPYELRQDSSAYIIILFLYIATLAIITIETAIVEKFFKNKKLFSLLLYTVVVFIAALLTFEPRFPLSAHEYGYFFAPIWDVSSGKTLFTDIHTDYGFYSTLFFTLLYKLGLFSFTQLPIYVWIMFVVQYFLSFYLIYKMSRSIALSLIGLFAIITINYFSFFVLPITITQYSAMRRLPSVLLLFLLYKFKKIDSPWLIILLSLFDFWVVDSGISIILAYGFSLFILVLIKQLEIKRFFKATALLFLVHAGVLLALNIVHLLFGYKPINPVDIFNSLRQHAALGLTMLPIESHTYFWIVIFIYFASIIYIMRKVLQESSIRHSSLKGNPFPSDVTSDSAPKRLSRAMSRDSEWVSSLSLIVLSSNLTLFNALYFVGRSHDANLFDISILVVLNCFLLFSPFWKSIVSNKTKVFIGALLFFLFIFFPAYNRRYALAEFILEKYTRFTRGAILRPETDLILKNTFAKDIDLISKHLKEKEVLILSREDTYLFLLSGKENLLDVNPQSAIDTVSEMDFAIKRAAEVCPKKLAVDCRVYNRCPAYESYSQKSLFMAPYILDTLEKRCQTKYEPIECTNQLCIAEKKR